jgi:hypothetical protein
MHMQDGIGRNGYRLLAATFLGLGVLGLVTTLYAFQRASSPAGLFDWLGFGLSLVALGALYALANVILMKPAAQPARAAQFTPQPTQPDKEWEAPPKEPDVETGPETVVPLPAAPKEPIPAPANRNLQRDTKGWPRRQPPSGLTMGEKRQLQQEAVQLLAGGEVEFAPTPPRKQMKVRTAPAVQVEEAPPVAARGEALPRITIARIAGPDDDPSWNPEGTTVGKCGGCGTRLYAPPERPLRLRCPKCEKVTTLQG